jgi:hypothetical protein
LFKVESKNGGDGLVILQDNANQGALAKTFKDIAKPFERGWGQTLPASRHHRQSIECVQLRVGPALPAHQAFALGASNFSLDGIFLQAAKKVDETWTKIQAMKKIGLAIAKILPQRGSVWICGRPQFDASPSAFGLAVFEEIGQARQVCGVIEERIDVIGKWQGNEARADEPAVHVAENHSISQLIAGTSRSKNERCVTLGPPQRLEPARCVKNRCARMTLQKNFPSRIGERIDRLKCFGNSSPCFLLWRWLARCLHLRTALTGTLWKFTN